MVQLQEAVEHLAAAADALIGVDFAAEPGLGAGLVDLARQADRVQAGWLAGLGAFDASGEAAADGAGSTQAWLRHRCRMHPRDASIQVRTARGLAELPETATALRRGEISARHAEVLAGAATDLGPDTARAAESTLVEAARRVDPKQLRQLTRQLQHALDPGGAHEDAEHQHARRRLSLSETFGGVFHLDGLLDSEGGETVLAALMPLAQPTGPDDTRSAAQRRADALTELARRALDGAGLPHAGGERPHINLTLSWETLRGTHGSPPAQAHWTGPLCAEIARRLVCDANLARVVTDDHPTDAGNGVFGHGDDGSMDSRSDGGTNDSDGASDGRPAREQAGGAATTSSRSDHGATAPASGWAGLPPVLRDPPSQILDVGRATRTVPPALRRALVVRDRGCRFTGCDRPPDWTDAHHIIHWAHGGATSLRGLVLLCRTHHRAVHEGGWTITGNPDGELRFEPPAAATARPPPSAA